jgi:hypothetical protein
MEAHHPETPTARAPFDDMVADVIIHSHDGVHFYVYKTVLALASPFFKDMFSLPQTTHSIQQAISKSAPVVDVAEDSQTLDHLLRLCYPIIDPVITELTEVGHVLEAAIKYQMEEATQLMRALLSTFVYDKPLQVYVIACHLQLETEAKASALHWCGKCPKVGPNISACGKLPDWTATLAGASYVPEMAQISAGSLFRLLDFVRTGGKTPSLIETDHLPTVTLGGGSEETVGFKHSFVYGDADIILQSSDGIIFRAHKLILSLASTNLVDKANITQESIPVITIPENGRILAKLLELCYPVGDSNLEDSDTALAVLLAATKYKMSKVIQLAKRHWMRHVKVAPLRIYFTAVRYGWKKEAKVAAGRAAAQPIENVYVPEMEFASAIAYHRLLKYRHNCRSAIVRTTCPYEIKPNEPWKADFSSWWDGGRVNGGEENDIPMLIAGPIVQRELRGRTNGPYGGGYGYGTAPDVRTLIDESCELEDKLRDALSKVSRAHSLEKVKVEDNMMFADRA